tara:strand:- start:2258 stop:3016 length:759 start_codon:yes stop_codon:yes gene_type:complete
MFNKFSFPGLTFSSKISIYCFLTFFYLISFNSYSAKSSTHFNYQSDVKYYKKYLKDNEGDKTRYPKNCGEIVRIRNGYTFLTREQKYKEGKENPNESVVFKTNRPGIKPPVARLKDGSYYKCVDVDRTYTGIKDPNSFKDNKRVNTCYSGTLYWKAKEDGEQFIRYDVNILSPGYPLPNRRDCVSGVSFDKRYDQKRGEIYKQNYTPVKSSWELEEEERIRKMKQESRERAEKERLEKEQKEDRLDELFGDF